ncbi:hypothetical protein HAX54_012327, partial [Datura stramonium]|nr:hypothetical protein [Datura stramonium]
MLSYSANRRFYFSTTKALPISSFVTVTFSHFAYQRFYLSTFKAPPIKSLSQQGSHAPPIESSILVLPKLLCQLKLLHYELLPSRRFYELLCQSESLQAASHRKPFIFTVAPPATSLSTSHLPRQTEAFYFTSSPCQPKATLQVASPVEAYTTTTQHIKDLSVKTVYANQEQLRISEYAMP